MKLFNGLRFSTVIFLLLVLEIASSTDCDRRPFGQQYRQANSDSGFEIVIHDSTTGHRAVTYKPGKLYNIQLTNWLANIKFVDFYLVAVPPGLPETEETRHPLGRFLHYPNPPVTKNVLGCPGLIKARFPSWRNHLHHVQLKWESPSEAGCVEFRATVVGTNSVYYKDTNRLLRVLCPELPRAPVPTSAAPPEPEAFKGRPEDYPNDQARPVPLADQASCHHMVPAVVHDCCACGTAIYQLTIDTYWTRQFHWRDWPEIKDGKGPEWSNILGVSHNKDYSVYNIGSEASPAVEALCAAGDLSKLEADFRVLAGDNIFTVIKARGFTNGDIAGKRSALFAVNSSHHLISFLAKLSPSPDWCTGVSQQDICQRNCSWPEELSWPLQAWDAGVRTGFNYRPRYGAEHPRMPTPDPICEIKPGWPRGNPFTQVDGVTKPVGRVTVKRLRINGAEECTNPDKQQERRQKDERSYQQRSPWETVMSSPPISSYSFSSSTTSNSVERGDQKLENCPVSEWGTWSQCSVTCDRGKQFRKRDAIIPNNVEDCKRVKLYDSQACIGTKVTCSPGPKCLKLPWGPWSPCNATCLLAGLEVRSKDTTSGRGQWVCKGEYDIPNEKRTCFRDNFQCSQLKMCNGGRPFESRKLNCRIFGKRYYYDSEKDTCHSFTYSDCTVLTSNNFVSNKACLDTCYSSSYTTTSPLSKNSQDNKYQVKEDRRRPKQCYMLKSLGRFCKRHPRQFRWFFDGRTLRCRRFAFRGCHKNGNNFISEESCRSTCDSTKEDQLDANDAAADPSNPIYQCQLSSWSTWTPSCSQLCSGYQRRTRGILEPSLLGLPCPSLEENQLCPKQIGNPYCLPVCRYSNWSGWTPCSKTCGLGIRQRTRYRASGSEYEDCRPSFPQFTERSWCSGNMDC